MLCFIACGAIMILQSHKQKYFITQHLIFYVPVRFVMKCSIQSKIVSLRCNFCCSHSRDDFL